MSVATKIFLVSTTLIWASGNQELEHCLVHRETVESVQLPVTISLKPESPKYNVDLLFLNASKTASLRVTLKNDADMGSHFARLTQDEWTYLHIERNCSHLVLRALGRPEHPARVSSIPNEPLYLQVKFHLGLSVTFNCLHMCPYEAKQPGYKLRFSPNKNVFFKPDLNFKSLFVIERIKSPLGHIIYEQREVTRENLGGPQLGWSQVKMYSQLSELISNNITLLNVDRFPDNVIFTIDGPSFWSDCNPKQNSVHSSKQKDIYKTECEETRTTHLPTPAATLTTLTTEIQRTHVASEGSVTYVLLVIMSAAAVLLRVVLVAKAAVYYKKILNTAQDHHTSSHRYTICLNIVLKSCLVVLTMFLCLMVFSLTLVLIIFHHLQVPNLSFILIIICGSVCLLLHIFLGLRRILSLVSSRRSRVEAGSKVSQGVSSVRGSGRTTNPHHSSQSTHVTDMAATVPEDSHDSLHEQLLCLTRLTQIVLKACLILLLLCLSIQVFSCYLVWKMRQLLY